MTMKLLHILCVLLLAPGLVLAQAGSQKSDSSSNNSDLATEVKALREALLQTQKQVAVQEREIETLKGERAKADPAPSAGNEPPPSAMHVATYTTVPSLGRPSSSPPGVVSADAGTPPAVQNQEKQKQEKENQRPLGSFNIGDAVFTPGGFVDFENIFRTTNTQNNIATNFAAIPYSSTPQGHLTELRVTGQYSRFNLKVEDKVGANDVIGYCEADFSGNDANNVYEVVNGHTLRLRLCFMDLRRGKWEFTGGQVYSWLTPNRSGVGSIPADEAITYNEDQNFQVGLTFDRAAEFRVAYHPNDHWAFGVGIEDPNQFTGTFVALPSAFASTVSSQFDNGAQIGPPNFFPDVLSKIAYDTRLGARHLHLEAVGLITGAHSAVVPIGEKSFSSHSVVGGGVSLAGNYEIFHNFLFLLNTFWSDGGSHYLVSDGPQLVVRPNAAGTDLFPSMVHAGAGEAGLEWIASKRSAFAVYYGEDYFGRNFFPDTTNAAAPTTIIGYGGPGSPNTNNRTIQEASFDWLQTFWKSDKYGALQYYTQYSYLSRDPWFVAPGAPKNAHLSMVYAGFRYVLPSTSGGLLRVPYPN
jgi:hypothetical protein